jgi:hypothetical protein
VQDRQILALDRAERDVFAVEHLSHLLGGGV